MKAIFAFILLVVFALSCKENKKDEYIKKRDIETAYEKQVHEGKKLMETYCYACHNPVTEEKNRIAPPMEAIKRHYITAKTDKDQFISEMLSWIKNPIEENSKMPGAVARFGVMPATPYPDNVIRQIADYMYDNDIQKPDWFEEHYNQERGKRGRMRMRKGMTFNTSSDSIDYGEVGLQYALSTKSELGKNLLGTIQKKGTMEAVRFCNERALLLTDSMETVHDARIKRVSDKPRNQNNKANIIELQYINTFKKMVENKEEIKPIVKDTNGRINFYYPIVTNAMCLQCHGKPTNQIKPEVITTLKRLYPNDKAIGYAENEVRGIWSIEFDK
ncbi:Tll0287-like domain-containing protein [Abyssalbus ytuae]|uniref:DUF3365 domain-containing protein n=1 Tax=Abyssalbus ytuae TaxID=2926907 RepID=A0A9E7CZ51_9FLAO|nr:DUF3365 domain-containing protein [Abyssalbus ytuae]UOB17260.1 DUF3365 domain-containing protein [Abyssalbus ytuae]